MNDQNGYCRTLKQQYAKTAIQNLQSSRGGNTEPKVLIRSKHEERDKSDSKSAD